MPTIVQPLRVVAASVAVLILAAFGRAAGQEPDVRPPVANRPSAPPAPPRTIVGIVVDTGDAPIDSIEIRIASLRRRAFTDTKGVFRFDDVRPGRYDLVARRLGFAPQVRRVVVGNDRGGSATFALLRVSYALPPVVTSSSRGGLSGVVGDTGFNVLRGADVYVVGSGHRTRTDSAGAFYMRVKPGRYMVQVTSAGFTRKLLSVTIPEDSGRHVTVWMVPSAGRTDFREANAIEGLRTRMMMRGATARFFTREDLSRFSMQWLAQLVVIGSGMPASDQCDAVVDGLWRIPIYALTVDELESVEVYPPGSLPNNQGSRVRSTRPRSIDPRGTDRRGAQPNCPGVFAWTRE